MNPTGTLQINTPAAEYITNDGRLVLTDGKSVEARTVFYKDALDINRIDAQTQRHFHTYFRFSIEDTGLGQGDGLTFLLFNNLPAWNGAGNEGMGYAFSGRKMVVFEFDTYRNDAEFMLPEPPNDDHIGFMLDGNNKEHWAYKDGYKFVTGPNKDWHVWIDYLPNVNGNGNGTFNVYASETNQRTLAPIAFVLNNPNGLSNKDPGNFDLAGHLVDYGNRAHPGFSSATGGSVNAHYIKEWEFSNNGEIPCMCVANDSPCAGTPTPACSMDAAAGGKKTQNKGICVECTNNNATECAKKSQVCKETNGVSDEVCVECNTASDCKDPTKPICDGNVCKCLKSLDCPTQTPVCMPNGCIICTSDTDCAERTDTPACNVSTGECVPCTATNESKCKKDNPPGCCNADNNTCKTADMCVEPSSSSSSSSVGGNGGNGGNGGAGGNGGNGGSGGTGNSDAGGNGGSGARPNNGIIQGSGCACAIPESSSREGMMGGFLAAAAGLALARRRRRSN